jgi:ribosomal protein S18 acetylase RimI-like enzyme
MADMTLDDPLLDDPLLVWARQEGRPGVREFTGAGATAVASPDLSRRDRLAVAGDPAGVAALLREVLPQVGAGYRPIGDEALIAAVAPEVPGLEVAGRFGWMETGRVTHPGRGRWLDDDSGVADLLTEAFPSSYAWPGGAGVRRWAGVHERRRLVATAAEAWSVPRIGFLAGVTTHPDARGRGLATAICAFVTRELLAGHERVALFVDYWNVAAVATYTRLGFGLRPLAAAKVGG